MKKKMKWFLIIISVFVSLLLLQSILIMTGVFNGFIRERLESFLSESLKGSCHITEIKGKWNYFSINGIEIRSEKLDSDIMTGELEIDILALIIKKVKISRLCLDSVNVFIKKDTMTIKSDSLSSKRTDLTEAIKSFPFTVNASEITLKRINVYYDTLYIKDIALNAVVSFNRKKGYLLYRVENCDVMGILNLKKTNGEFKLKSDSLSHSGNFSCGVFEIDNSIGYKNGNLFIDKALFKFSAERKKLFGAEITASGDGFLAGSIVNGRAEMKLKADLKRVGVDTLLFEQVSIGAEMTGDTIWLNELDCRDDEFLVSGKGFVELSPGVGGEFDVALSRVCAQKFIKNQSIAENSFDGLLHIKTDFKESVALVIDSMRGFYGNIKNISLKGSASFINSELSLNNVLMKIEDGEISLNGSIDKTRGQANLKMSNFSLEVLSAIKSDLNLSGHMNGELSLFGGISGYKCVYNIEMTNGFYESNTFEYFNSSGYFLGSNDSIYKGVIQGSFINGVVLNKNVSIVYFESMKGEDKLYLDVDGVSDMLSFGASCIFSLNRDFSEGRGSISRLNIKTDVDEYSLDNDIKIEYNKKMFMVDSLSLSGKYGFLKGNFKSTEDSMNFKIDAFDKNMIMTGYITNVPINGDARISAEGNGRIDSLMMKMNASVVGAEFEGISMDSLFMNCDYDGDNLDINYLNAYHENELSYLFGRIMIDKDSIKNSIMEISFDLKNIDEKYFLPLENVFTVKTKTGLTGKGRIYGKVTEPKLEGNIVIDSTDVFIVSLGTTVKAAKGYAVLSGDSAIVKELRGKTEKGALLLTGGVSLDKYMMEEYWFKILAEGAHSTGIDYVDVFANCSLDIRGDMKKVDMNGLIKITEGVSNFPFIASSENGQQSVASKYQSNMNLHLINDNNLWLKNSFVDAELKGDVFLKKNGTKWNITGKANVIRGYYFYLDKKFKITSGLFELKETSKIVEPVINITSSTRIQYVDGDEKKQADVFLEATGSAFNPTVSLYSEPTMGIENIISILSFNTTLSSLSNFEEISKGVPEKALQIYLRNKYLNTISSSIGVDQLDIQTNLLGSEKSAKLSVGKYIGKRLYVSYTHDVFTFEKDVFRIEYNVIKNTDIVTERDEQGYFNTGLQFKYRF
ncbi:MAG: translocation/assembly module TamB domain-containing protein [bacterium]